MPTVDTTLRTYADAYLMCRDLGHAWAENEAVKQRQDGVHAIARVLNCTRCTMARLDRFTFRGELLSRQYRQPKGYHLEFRPLSEEVRKARFAELRKQLQTDNSMDLTTREYHAPDDVRAPRSRERRLASVR